MLTMRFPRFALVGVLASPFLFLFGFLFLFVSSIRYGIEPALPIGVGLILLGVVLLTSGIVLIGVYQMLKSTTRQPSTSDES
jgi:membrane-bound ClpP family serine protease